MLSMRVDRFAALGRHRASAGRLALSLLLSLVSIACRPSIGDPCTTSLDCSQMGDRLCDASQPAGYCTVFNCLPDLCPDNAACVGFGAALDPTCTQFDPRPPRFEQTFCMKPCKDSTDCRQGYECHAFADKRAVQIDVTEPFKVAKVCFPASTAQPDMASHADTCTPPGLTGSSSSASSGASSSSSSGSSSSSSSSGSSSSSSSSSGSSSSSSSSSGG